jgi:hypothetical protein
MIYWNKGFRGCFLQICRYASKMANHWIRIRVHALLPTWENGETGWDYTGYHAPGRLQLCYLRVFIQCTMIFLSYLICMYMVLKSLKNSIFTKRFCFCFCFQVCRLLLELMSSHADGDGIQRVKSLDGEYQYVVYGFNITQKIIYYWP